MENKINDSMEFVKSSKVLDIKFYKTYYCHKIMKVHECYF